MRICCLLHSAYAGRLYLEEWARRRGHDWETVLVPEARELPRPSELDCLMILGGPMSVWEEKRHPWLASEKKLLARLVEAGKPVLGICLGAQLLAELLGARVYGGAHKEIGWFTATTTGEARLGWPGEALPERFETFFWHGDSFDLPPGATRIASSAAFENQGFFYGRSLALQFHLEVRPRWVTMLAERDAAELVDAPFVQSAELILGKPDSTFERNNRMMDALLDRWLETIDAPIARRNDT